MQAATYKPTWTLSLLGVLWILLFHQVSPVWSVVPQYSYGWFVPILAAYVFLNRWKTRPEPSPTAERVSFLLIGCVIMGAVGLIRLVQEANRDWHLVSWALGLLLAATTWLTLGHAGGSPWRRHFLFACIFPLIAVPWPSRIEELLVDTFMNTVAGVATEVMTHFGIPAFQTGNIITTSRGQVGVDEACSGIQSFQASVMMSLFLGELLALSRFARVLLLAAAVAWSFACNLGRSIFLGFTTHQGGVAALDKVHDSAGLAVMFFSYAGIIGLALWLARTVPVPKPTNPSGSPRWISPRIAIAALLFLLVNQIGVEAWYRSKETGRIRQPNWTAVLDDKIEGIRPGEFTGVERKVLRFNAGSRGELRTPEGRRWSMAFMRWEAGNLAVDSSKNHNPAICLVGSGYVMETNYVPARIFKAGGVEVPFRRFKFVRGATSMYSFFCLWDDFNQSTGVGRDADDFWTASARIRNVIRRQRTAGIQMLNAGGFEYEDPESAAREFQSILDRISRPK